MLASQMIEDCIFFSGIKNLCLRCDSREDCSAWIKACYLLKISYSRANDSCAVLSQPRALTSNDSAPTIDLSVSTGRLHEWLLQEGLKERATNECESIMMFELTGMQNKLKSLHQKHIVFLGTLRQLEVTIFEGCDGVFISSFFILQFDFLLIVHVQHIIHYCNIN